MERSTGLAPRAADGMAAGPVAGVGRIIVAIAAAAGLCFVHGVVQGGAWADAIRGVPEHELGPGLCLMCHGLATAPGLLWLGCVLIVLVPAAIIGHSPTPWRRAGLVGLIVAVVAAALTGFALSTSIGGRYGFPEAEIPFGIFLGLSTVSVGAVFGFAVGRLIRRREAGTHPSSAERAALIATGVVVGLVLVLALILLVDAVLFGQANTGA